MSYDLFIQPSQESEIFERKVIDEFFAMQQNIDREVDQYIYHGTDLRSFVSFDIAYSPDGKGSIESNEIINRIEVSISLGGERDSILTETLNICKGLAQSLSAYVYDLQTGKIIKPDE